MFPSIDIDAPLAWTIPDILNAGECSVLIARIEREGPSPAPITTARGFVMRPDIRNNDRIIFDDTELAATLYTRARASIPNTMFGGAIPIGANERFRCYRYSPGQRFAPHYDGAYRRNAFVESPAVVQGVASRQEQAQTPRLHTVQQNQLSEQFLLATLKTSTLPARPCSANQNA